MPIRLLFLAFFLSGASGLIYQTVWVRMLTRFLGSTTAAAATVLCVFMGGLALGSYIGGKLADRKKNLLDYYAILEILIALLGLLASFAIISWLGGFYVGIFHLFQGKTGVLLFARVLFAMLCLLPPTLLMGATLPLLVAFVTRYREELQSGIGRLYSVNTFGAVVGVLLTGFLLLGALGESNSIGIAAILNSIAAIAANRVSRSLRSLGQGIEEKDNQERIPWLGSVPYTKGIRLWSTAAIFVSGFTALAYEILWTRLLMLPLATSIYAFSFMLATFLAGIAIGSWLSTRFAFSSACPASTFGMLEIFIGFWTAVGMLAFPALEAFSPQSVSLHFFVKLLISFFLVFPVAVFFGWQFPVAVRCCVSDVKSPGKETGWAYAVNTTGAISGSVLAGFLLLPVFGTAETQVLLATLNIILGCVLLWISPREERGRLPWVAGMAAMGFILMVLFVGDPYRTVINQRVIKIWGDNAQVYASHEDIEGTVVAAGSSDHPRRRSLLINGVGVTSLQTETKLMAHLPMALVENAHRMLVICFGMGTTVRSASHYQGLTIDAVDIVPRVFDYFKYFHDDASQVAALPNVSFKRDDGRNFLLVHHEPYDIIIVDPSPPIHSAGTVNLYTKEFFQLCRSRLSKNGAVCLWLPPAPISELLMIIRSFTEVFPASSMWGPLNYPGLYLVGGWHSFEQTNDSVSLVAKRLSSVEDLTEWDATYGNEEGLKDLFLLNARELSPLLAAFPELTDDEPYTEFPLWRVLFTRTGQLLFSSEQVRQAIKQSTLPKNP
jgi:spermidine synthase